MRIGGVGVWGPTDRMRNEIELRAPWISEDEAGELIDEINLTPEWHRRPITVGFEKNITFWIENCAVCYSEAGPCRRPLWVISGHGGTNLRCPLFSQKRTLPNATWMSALCQ